MEIKNGQPRDHEIHNPTSVMAQEQHSAPKSDKESAPYSVVDNVNTTSSTGMSAAKSGAKNADSIGNDTFGKQAVSDLYEYASSNPDYDITPEQIYTQYNVTGTDTKSRRKLARLVDALNARKWGTTTAALGASGEGTIRNQSPNLWVDMSMPNISTAESRAQERAEGYEAAAGQSAISRSDFLKRLAPQLEQIRNSLKTQFGANLDNSQVRALDSAINLFYTEKLQEFSHRELIRHALNASNVMRALPLDSQKIFFGSMMQLPIMSNAMQTATDETGKAYQYAATHNGQVTPEMRDSLITMQQVLQNPVSMGTAYSLLQAAGLSSQAIDYIKNGKL